MRLVVLCLVLFVGVARADEEEDVDGDFVALPKRAVGVMFVAHSGRLGGRAEGGAGAVLDLALGRGRWQYFIEGAYSSAGVGEVEVMRVNGRMIHGGLGARWLARQFRDQNKNGGFEMFLSSVVGVQRFYLEDGMRMTRPELAFGFGMNARLYKRPRLGLRFELRVVFTPNNEELESGTNTGYIAATGVTW